MFKIQRIAFSTEFQTELFIFRPVLHNPFTTDEFLNDYLLRYCPESRYEIIKSDLVRFGDRIVSEIDQLGIECEGTRDPWTQFYQSKIDLGNPRYG